MQSEIRYCPKLQSVIATIGRASLETAEPGDYLLKEKGQPGRAQAYDMVSDQMRSVLLTGRLFAHVCGSQLPKQPCGDLNAWNRESDGKTVIVYPEIECVS